MRLCEYVSLGKPHRDWVKAVKERDNYTCQDCGATGVEMCAFHLKPPFGGHNEDSLDDGITVCRPCLRRRCPWTLPKAEREEGA